MGTKLLGFFAVATELVLNGVVVGPLTIGTGNGVVVELVAWLAIGDGVRVGVRALHCWMGHTFKPGCEASRAEIRRSGSTRIVDRCGCS